MRHDLQGAGTSDLIGGKADCAAPDAVTLDVGRGVTGTAAYLTEVVSVEPCKW
jgi:hypothetical protein